MSLSRTTVPVCRETGILLTGLIREYIACGRMPDVLPFAQRVRGARVPGTG